MNQAAPIPTTTRAREQWIDVAKGGTMAIIILAHVIVSSHDAGQFEDAGFWSAVTFTNYMSGLMAVFMFLAGMFVPARLQRPGTFVRSVATTLVWPYLLWGGLFLIGQSLLGNARNSAGTVASDISLLWTPIAWLWFLYALQLLALLFRRHLWALVLLGLAVLPLTEVSPTLFGRQLAYLLIYFGLGAWLAAPTIPRPPLPVALAGATGGAVIAWWWDVAFFSAVTAPAAYLWLTATIDLSKRAGGSVERTLSWLGRRSMAIYVSHFFFITATRIALDRGPGITDFAVHLPLGFAAGLAGSLAALALSQRLGIAWLLGFGSIPPTWPARPAARDGEARAAR